jgi:hypothetical protein
VAGGIVAATYEVHARRRGLPVGLYFQLNGVMSIVGGILTFIALILSAILNPWWTIFIVLTIGWIFGELIMTIFNSLSQIISLVLIALGIILFLIAM